MSFKVKSIAEKPRWSLASVFILAYVVSVPIQIPVLPEGISLNGKVLLPEVVFAALGFFLLISRPEWLRVHKMMPLDIVAIGYPAAVFLNMAVHWDSGIFPEFLGALYLGCLYYILSRYLIASELSFNRRTTTGVISVLAISGILYALSWTQQFQELLNWEFKGYPYFGDVDRFMGLAKTPNMMMGIVAIATLIGVSIAHPRLKWLIAGLGIVICFSTLSKSIIILFAGLVIAAILWIVKARLYRILAVSLVFAGTLVLFLMATMFVPSNVNDDAIPNRLTGHDPLVTHGDTEVYGTSYYYLKSTMIKTLPENVISGVGYGKFQSEIASYKDRGIYPRHLPAYEAHDSYLGVISEGGLMGILQLMAVAVALILIVPLRHECGTAFVVLAASVLTYIIIESTCIDAWNFRHFWIAISVISARSNGDTVHMSL